MISELLSDERGMIEGILISALLIIEPLFLDGTIEKEDIGKKNGAVALFDFATKCCWFNIVSFTPVTLML